MWMTASPEEGNAVSRWSVPEVPSSDQLLPYDLRCEHRDSPLGIDTKAPRLSWRLTSSRRADTQTAYRVSVSAVAGTDLREVPVWDSGWVSGGQVHVDYAGAPLTSATRYVWR